MGHQIRARLSHTSPRRFRLAYNPAAGIPTEPKVVGTRWLDEEEFVQLYRWLEYPDAPVHPPYTRAVRILMLTGQRVEEIARLHDGPMGSRRSRLSTGRRRKTASRTQSLFRRSRPSSSIHHSKQVWMVLPFCNGPFKAGERQHPL